MTGQLWRAHLALVAVAAAAFAWTSAPRARDALWLLVAWAAVAALLAGIRLHRPARSGPWLLTAGGLSLTAVAAALAPSSSGLPPDAPPVVLANLCHVASYLLIGGAVLWFVRLQVGRRDLDGLVDAAVVTVALASVLWSVVIDPSALGADASLSGRLVFVVAPLLPAGVTAVCVRLLVGAGGRLPAARLLGGAWILAFVGSIGWILLLQAGAASPAGWPTLVWMAALGCAGASGLHPSMAALSDAPAPADRTLTRARVGVLGAALLTTPVALLTGTDPAQVHVVVPVAGAGLVALLVLVRLGRLVDEREQARGELEVHAARQEVVARLGEVALGERSTASLHGEAARLVAGVLDDVEVVLGDRRAGPAPTHATTLAALPVGAVDGSGATLEVRGGATRVLTVQERVFVSSVAGVLSNVAARRQAEDDLRRRALHDHLTGLPNRLLVLERLGQAVRQRDRGPVGVLFVDLDGFKPVNDRHGHGVGDVLLTTLADRLPSVLRTGDTVGRLAGDEFVVVAPDCDEHGLAELGARVVAAVRQPVHVDGVEVGVSASVGAVLATDADRDPREVLLRADAAMYEAKAAGGGCVVGVAAVPTP